MASIGKSPKAATFLDRFVTTPLVRLSFCGYFVYLTLLLLTPDPFRLVASTPGAVHVLQLLNPLAHGLSFAILTALALLAFRPLPQPAICIGLSGYASLTELLQMYIPPRTAEWQDWFQDIGGIALVILVGWLVATLWRALRNAEKNVSPEISPRNSRSA
jgi:VanZ family protein